VTLPTDKQESYADVLVNKLRAADHFMAERFAKQVLDCTDKWEMSKLIDRMKGELEEIEEMDSMVDRSHRQVP